MLNINLMLPCWLVTFSAQLHAKGQRWAFVDALVAAPDAFGGDAMDLTALEGVRDLIVKFAMACRGGSGGGGGGGGRVQQSRATSGIRPPAGPARG